MTTEQLDNIRARHAEGFAPRMADATLLLAEVERLTADPLPAAAWVREVERAAFQRGVAAMREAAAQHFEERAKQQRFAGDFFMPPVHEASAQRLRALPDPEDTP